MTTIGGILVVTFIGDGSVGGVAGSGEGGMPCDNAVSECSVLEDGDAVGGVLSNMVGWFLVGWILVGRKGRE